MNEQTIKMVLKCARLRRARARGEILPPFQARMLEQSYTGSVGGRDVPLVTFATDILKTLDGLPVAEKQPFKKRPLKKKRKRNKDEKAEDS